VTGYIIARNTGSGFVPFATNPPTQLAYTNISGGTNTQYQICAVYNGRDSVWSAASSVSAYMQSGQPVPGAIVRGPGGNLYLIVSQIPSGISAIRVINIFSA